MKLDLGTVPIDREVRPVLEAAIAKIAGLYGDLEECSPDFSGAMDAFHAPARLYPLPHARPLT